MLEYTSRAMPASRRGPVLVKVTRVRDGVTHSWVGEIKSVGALGIMLAIRGAETTGLAFPLTIEEYTEADPVPLLDAIRGSLAASRSGCREMLPDGTPASKYAGVDYTAADWRQHERYLDACDARDKWRDD